MLLLQNDFMGEFQGSGAACRVQGEFSLPVPSLSQPLEKQGLPLERILLQVGGNLILLENSKEMEPLLAPRESFSLFPPTPGKTGPSSEGILFQNDFIGEF